MVCTGAVKERVMGNPVKELVSTSYVERANLTMRMHMRRFTRLTNAFSKKAENHAHAVSLHFMFYNFCRPHTTLTKAAKGYKTTPAMAAGVTDQRLDGRGNPKPYERPNWMNVTAQNRTLPGRRLTKNCALRTDCAFGNPARVAHKDGPALRLFEVGSQCAQGSQMRNQSAMHN